LLALAIFDDVGAIVVVAVAYAGELRWLPIVGALLALAGTGIAARLGIRNLTVYTLLGVLSWLFFDRSGIHPTIAGVILGLITPTGAWVSGDRLDAILGKVLARPTGDRSRSDPAGRRDLRRAGVAATEAISPVERLELKLHPWASFAIMPVFAFANAGIPIYSGDLGHPLSTAFFAGLVLGKPIGVIVASWLAVITRVAIKTAELSWTQLAAGSALTGIGFTMSLFIAELAYKPDLIGAAKLGILVASSVSAVTGLVLLYMLSRTPKRGCNSP
jgi:NhaA family Na+:H+ antiporter